MLSKLSCSAQLPFCGSGRSNGGPRSCSCAMSPQPCCNTDMHVTKPSKLCIVVRPERSRDTCIEVHIQQNDGQQGPVVSLCFVANCLPHSSALACRSRPEAGAHQQKC